MPVRRETCMEQLLPADFFRKIAAGEYERKYYPSFSDRAAWKKVRNHEAAKRLIALADAVPESPPEPTAYSEYRKFAVTGNRVDFQQIYLCRRKELSALVMAVCLTGNMEKYRVRLMDRLIAILEEWTWCLPAHVNWDREGLFPKKPYPADLFSCDTGAMLAGTVKLLGEELENEWAGITEWIRQETVERTIYTVLKHTELNRHGWYRGDCPNNWTIWCGYNCMAIAVQFVQDPGELADVLQKFYNTASLFYAAYGEDGFCDEGPTYYARAGSMLFRAVDLMDKLRPGSGAKTYADSKFKAIQEYIAHVRIGNNCMITYGDAQTSEMTKWFSCIVPAGAAVGSEIMVDMGRDRIPSLGTDGDLITESLAILFDMPRKRRAGKKMKQIPISCFKGRLGVMRSDGFSASLKGGHNGESHNHNDLGHFELFFEGEPVIVDAGTEAYSKINFTPGARYTLWYTRGTGHNAPVIGDTEQCAGRDYTATLDVLEEDRGLYSDLSKAYPAEAGVRSFIRKLHFAPEQVVVEDTLSLKTECPVTIYLPVSGKPVIREDGTVKMGKVKLTPEGLTAVGVGPGKRLMFGKRSSWKKPIYLLKLTGMVPHYKLIFTKG